MSDEEIWALNRGGHDPQKVYAAYAAASAHTGQPTVILAKTIKGYGMGEAGEGQNITHQQKKMNEEALLAFRDRFGLELTDEQVHDAAFYKPADDSPEMALPARAPRGARRRRCRRARRTPTALRGPGARPRSAGSSRAPASARSRRRWRSSGSSPRSLRDKQIGKHVVPIVPDESRTFGMEGMFRQLGIFSQVGQLYKPEDPDQLMFYREDKQGQILQEGINEPGAMSSWIAAARRTPTTACRRSRSTSTTRCSASSGSATSPGPRATAARAGSCSAAPRGARRSTARACSTRTATRTCSASTIPNCVSYDPTYGYEVAVIVQRRPAADARRAGGRLLLPHADERELPAPGDAGGRGGGDPARDVPAARGRATATRRASSCWARARSCARCWPAPSCCARTSASRADVWSVTSFTELRREGMEAERWNTLHPTEEARGARTSSVRSTGATGR